MGRFKRKQSSPVRNKKPTALLCADIHLRTTQPACRTDDFINAMCNKWLHILGISSEYGQIPILVAGDLGEKSQWPNWLERWFIYYANLGGPIYLVPGQHDLPNHRLDLWEKSAIGVLEAAGSIQVLRAGCYIDPFQVTAFPYGEKFGPAHPIKNEINVAIAHMMVLEDKPLWPGQEADNAQTILRKYPDYDLILTGDNHNPFVSSYKRRLLVNPGSMTRHKADQINHRPRVYLWYAEDNTVEPVFLPIEEDVVSRVHIDTKEVRDERIELFVSHLKDDYEIGLDFEENVEEFFRANRTRKTIKDRTWEFIGGNNEI